MGILKKENCSTVIYLLLLAAPALMTGSISFGSHRTAIEALLNAYKLDPVITPAKAESAVASLEKALVNCKDEDIAFRIRYTIGVIYFKAHMMEASKTAFLQIANAPACPELIRVCSFNMIGQICRLSGQNKEALEAFNQVINLSEQDLSFNKGAAYPALVKLWCAALFSRAEIYELQRNLNAGITEYNRLLNGLRQIKNNDMLSRYAPLANDRMSQLYIRQGDIDTYIKLAEALTINYPEYYRAPIIKLEIECVKFLKDIHEDPEFVNGSYVVPANVIAYLNGSKEKTSAYPIANKLAILSKENQNSYSWFLLQYEYAWLLDALGERDKAAEALSQITSSNLASLGNGLNRIAVVKMIQDYAKIQRAIILGEKANYTEALEMLATLRSDPNESHISKLAESVTESIQILKREVSKNESEQK
jgi:hypothetical protein